MILKCETRNNFESHENFCESYIMQQVYKSEVLLDKCGKFVNEQIKCLMDEVHCERSTKFK